MDNKYCTEENKTVVADTSPELPSNMSKRQFKKMQKMKKWLEQKDEKRLRERAKAREKRAYARANNLSLGPSRKLLKKSTMAISPCKLMVTIDLSFDELMIDKDIAKLTKQILRCYTLNRRAIAPMQFSLTSFTGRSRADMEKHNGYEHWDVNFHTESYINIYPKDKIVYLTSESENVIDRLNHEWVYIIGGLVDHNAHKGICYKLAKDAGIRHGRLPLDKFLQMKARKVLTIDHVFEILLRVTEGNTWQEAFLKVLPERKNAKPIVPVLQSKEDESLQDPMPVDVNSAILVNVNNTMQIDVSNTMPVDIHNVCNQEKDNKLESNVESKKVLEEHLCAI
ncbi:RNA (guanine-9-)-methyltransferase domain-containing protein 2 [Camponotus floridanus]|uniref:tRNA (guanine(9)-N(1))-methyltransferase n=1 Tax=Camponotus floridanus TaxID=104421 RepID=E2A6Z7_CAMFO|nr:tRNA methyltransferase 10 homolog A [Camponotus floridanus]XP_025271417.1 tRNA methyltransferase 10 homolog A [Camponotus floridanus]EFN70800.1 RNA (guanine-9-)-methyltransferase domain-containing protein 2 [Camponotus floridanus]